MKTIERIFQAITYELVALALIVPTTFFIGGFKSSDVIIFSLGLSLSSMCWNYVYNILFDKVVGNNRLNRGNVLRFIHACGFELGFIMITLPILAWHLNITWTAAAILEAGMLCFFLVYTFVFNTLYDKYQPYKHCLRKHSTIKC